MQKIQKKEAAQGCLRVVLFTNDMHKPILFSL